ncbi:MAG: enoyl-CoA hydratase/isomerase family protein [Planctomycetes bacterium]|nr:enoyl-CoA hydratase/isomerase family protein [Planctomycetota bacterium]
MSFFDPEVRSGAAPEDVLYRKEGGVATITLNRPKALNAYATPTLRELARAFQQAAWDDGVAVIVFTGAGERAFCTGGDVKEYEEVYTRRPRDYWKYMGLFRAYLESILNNGKVTIARLNGMTVGGGNESHLACDLSVAAEHARLFQVGTGVGSVACGGATQWLPLAVGDRRAREMLFLNEPVPARKALEWGLVNQVVPSVRQGDRWVESASPEEIEKALAGRDGYRIDFAKLDEAVQALATKLAEKFPECTRYTKQQVNYWKELAWHQTIGHARDWLSLHFACVEPFEGMRAFVEKRKPRVRQLREKAALGGSSELLWGANARRCAACGARDLPADFKFCGVCGSLLS